MDVREKLVELLTNSPQLDVLDWTTGWEEAANYLIANGVTVQECGHWVSYQSDDPYGCMDDKEWYRCSKCGKDAHGRCYEDEWYSAPNLSSHCPHCRAKKMPKPPKGD